MIVALSTSVYGQEKSEHDINIIISIDDKIQVGTITNSRIIVYSNDNEKEVFDVDYSPGSLLLSDSIFDKLTSDNVGKMYLAFDYSVFRKEKQSTNNYQLEIAPALFDYRYAILKIYNPRKGNNYSYVVDIPGQSIVMDREKN
ncbi:hypothetical protein C900_02842 [Fulvivirga imtechensis AK7]|uniref:Uncharacterized protein n=1 Tax=Fulvivirga imtechensis AK7 TaxID=1237149 RepID=L8JQV1_9BACT|nr:hypothetical protein [Fulvivirga imtechensis]ELR71341.1 hypothetical protein C900_02842 [Fulvivirga imtechensis AK7]